MGLVAIGRDRDLLRRHRHLRRRDVAQLDDSGARKRRSPAAKPTRSPGRFERFDSEWNTTTLAKSGADASQHAVRRAAVADRSRSSIRRRTPGSRSGAPARRGASDRPRRRPRPAGSTARRDRRRRCARAASSIERVEIGQEAGFARGRQIDRLAVGGGGAGRIGGVERIGDQDRGLAGARRAHSAWRRCAPRNRPSRVPFSTMTSVSGSIGRGERVAPAEPGGGGLAEALGALVGRIAAEIVQMRLQAPGRRTAESGAAARRPRD